MWNVVFMGIPDFAVGSLRALLEAGQYHIQAVVTQPDRPKGRGQKVVETPVKAFALRHELPVYQPLRVKEPEFVQKLKEWKPDFIVVAAFGQFLSQEILDIPTYGCINVHGSLLPRYRGAAPIQYAILNGEKETGVTIMRMEKGMDTGPMYSKVTVPIEEEMNFARLHDELMEKGAKLLTDTLPEIAGGLQPEEQDCREATYATLITKEMAKIDWTRPVREVHDRVRGFDPAPGAFTYLPDGKLLKIWETRVADNSTGAAAGTVVSVSKNEFSVACGEGVLRVLTVQPESKKRMPAAVFLNGHGVKAGDVLGSKE